MNKEMKNENIKVTIITTTYMKFDRFEESVASVAKQSFENYEYIVSDDGSDDFSYEYVESIIKKYGIKNFKIMHSDVNQGTVKNVNCACRASSGDIIMFLSCGDIFTSDDIVTKVAMIYSTKGFDLLCVRRIAYSDKPQFFLPHICCIPIILRLKTKTEQYRAFITTHYWNMASGSATYYSKRILEEMNYFDEKYRLWEDGPFFEKFLRNYKLEFAYDIIAIWYELGGVSTGSPNKYLEQDRLLFDKTDRQFMKAKLGVYAKKYVEYIYRRSKCNDRKSLNSLRLQYPMIMISHITYKLCDGLFKIIDRVYLRLNSSWNNRFNEVQTK